MAAKRPVLVASIVAFLLAAGSPAGATVPPYAASDVGASHSTHIDSRPGTATATSGASADAATGVLAISAHANDSFPVGRAVVTTISYGQGSGSAWVKISRTVPPGDYVVTAKYKNARADVVRQTGVIGTIPQGVGPLVQSAQAWSYANLTGGCANCSVSSTQYLYPYSTPRSGTLLLAVTVPEGPDVVLTATAYLHASAYVYGEATASVEASATVERVAVFRGDEEV